MNNGETSTFHNSQETFSENGALSVDLKRIEAIWHENGLAKSNINSSPSNADEDTRKRAVVFIGLA
jgi:hypothetical protein